MKPSPDPGHAVDYDCKHHYACEAGKIRGNRTSFFMAAQNSWLVSSPDPLLSNTCKHTHETFIFRFANSVVLGWPVMTCNARHITLL